MGNHSTSCYYVIDFVLTYIPSLIIGPIIVPAIRFCYTFTTKVIVLNRGLNNMLPKALVVTTLATATTSGLGDTSIADTDS